MRMCEQTLRRTQWSFLLLFPIWVLPISTLSSVCAVQRRTYLAGGKSDAILDVDGRELKRQCSESHHTNTFVTVTLEATVSHFSFFQVSHFPCRLVYSGCQVVFRSFPKEGKSFKGYTDGNSMANCLGVWQLKFKPHLESQVKLMQQQDARVYNKTCSYVYQIQSRKMEWEKEITSVDVRWRNVPAPSLRINSGAIFKKLI